MSDDLKALFERRASGDTQTLASEMQANTSLQKLVTSLDGLKGKGFEVEVGSVKTTTPTQDGSVYKAPVVGREIKVTHKKRIRSNETASLTVTLDVNGEYGFKTEGAVTTELESTSVKTAAGNNLQKWLVDVQGAFGVDILSTAMARQEERAEAKGQRRNPKPA